MEDEEVLLTMSAEVLTQLGYTVLSANTPETALRVATEHPEAIGMLITDVIMPETSGRDLAERVVALRPEIKLLFISGYPADFIANRGVLEEGVNFLPKPFSLQDLAVKVRDILAT